MSTTIFNNLDSYLGHFAVHMAERINVGLPPLFDPETDALSAEVRALTNCEMVPYPAQAVAVEGIVRCYQHNRVAHLIGEMGTGKTPMACWIVLVMQQRLMRPMRVVVTAPNQLVKKWKKHFERVIPGCDATIIRNWKDLRALVDRATSIDKNVMGSAGTPRTQKVRRWTDPARTEVWIVPRDKGKLGYAWSHGVHVQRKILKRRIDDGGPGSTPRYSKVSALYYQCPRCASAIKDENGVPVSHLHFQTSAGKPKKKLLCKCPDREIVKLQEGDGHYPGRWCRHGSRPHQGEQLWQAFNGAINRSPSSVYKGSPRLRDKTLPLPGISPRRMAPCQYLRQIKARFDLYVADEVHELKGAGTLQGQMFADLCLISDRVLMTTGTIVGGYAENLLHLLWRTIPHRMRDDGLTFDYKGFETFTKLYGVLQEQTRYVADDYQSSRDLLQGRGRVMSRRTKALPGISPVLFTNFLLDQSVFLRLAEMHSHLPKFHERVHMVRLEPEQDAALKQMQKDFDDHRSRMRSAGQPCRAWAAARAAFLRWPDKPWIAPFTVYDMNPETGAKIVAFHVPTLPQKEYPKERRVRRLITRNMIRGRKTWVFTELTGEDGHPEWDLMSYLQQYLESHGIRAAVLRAEGSGGPKPEDREEWIAKTAPNVDCIISNPNLVKTGLDLFDFPSIVFAYCGDNTYTLRQASRRAWRLGQKMTCEVDYLVSVGRKSKSVQEAALSLMAQKMEASMAIEGDFSSEGLAAMAQSEDMASQLARFIDGTLDDLAPATTAFERYRQKLEACMPNLAKDLEQDQVAVAPESRRPMPVARPIVLDDPRIEPEPPTIDDLPPALPAEEIQSPAFNILRSLGLEPTPIKTEAEQLFDRKHDAKASTIEPEVVAERKRCRLGALTIALKRQPSESRGDLHRFGNRWVQLVAKRRSTVRDRNFTAAYAAHPDAWIAFVEPSDDVGPTLSQTRVMFDGVDYVVSMMPMADYMAGERTPGEPLSAVGISGLQAGEDVKTNGESA